jgi:hypothetical protein
MLIEDVLGKTTGLDLSESQLIKQQCSQYLKESAGLPLLKSLPSTYSNFQKVKVRLQKNQDPINEAFDKAFGKEFFNLRQRAIFANASQPALKEGSDLFYVFPINGYKFLYSKTISNSSSDYRQVIDTLIESFQDQNQATEIITDILKMSYCTDDLLEGITSNSEVIFYGIPFYFAIRTSAIPAYSKLFT